MNAPAKITGAAITHADFYKLCEWLKTANLAGLHTRAKTADAATKAIGVEFSVSSISNALETTGVTLPDPEPSPQIKQNRTAIVARDLIALMKSLGHEPSGELVAVSQGTSLK